MKTRVMFAPALGVVLMASIAVLGSCRGLAPGQDGVQAIQFQDVVVPAGLRLIEDAHQSHSIEAASWREGRFIYSGLVAAEDAAAYVRQRMPLHNWELVADETPEPKMTRMRYVRGYYAAEYTFTRSEGRTQLVVEYGTDYSRR